MRPLRPTALRLRAAVPRTAVLGTPLLAALLLAALLLAALLLGAPVARAEYRAYELEVVDLYDCRINKRPECRTGHVSTSLDPNQYLLTHGGDYHVGVILLATWMCYGDTSTYKPVCPRPVTRNPKFNPGDEVEIALQKHITEGWRGKVEVAYYQHSVRSNVYGVRFADRRSVYARYYEKDLRKAGAASASSTPPAAGTAPPAAQIAGAGTGAGPAPGAQPQAPPAQ